MAYDKVVDSAALDAAMTDIADSIRAKTGKTEPLTLAQMPSEIEGISGGSVYENLKYAKKVSFANTTLPDTFEVTLPNGQTDFSYLFERVYVKNIIVHSSITPTSMVETFKYANLGGLCTITLDFDTSKVTTYNNCFAFGIGDWGAHFTAIYGVIDFTSATTSGVAYMFGATYYLKDVTFAANTLGANFDASEIPNINDVSLLSLINCLKNRTGEDALTLTVASEWKTADTGRLYVNYVKLDANTGLYVSCEQTDAGAMTIAAAITAKNWTIA